MTESCRSSGRPYMQSVKGGEQISPEGYDHGMQVVFVLEFYVSCTGVKSLLGSASLTVQNKGDLIYYIKEDPAHLAFDVGCSLGD